MLDPTPEAAFMIPVHGQAELARLADQCVMCGLCLPHCPSYALTRNEADSPRGRITLVKAWAEGSRTLDEAAMLHLDRCLGCLRCERVCPAKVEYAPLWHAARATRSRPWRERWAFLIGRSKWLALALQAARRLRLLALPRRIAGLVFGAAAANTVQSLGRRADNRPIEALAAAGERIALFAGCATRRWDRPAVVGVQRLLRAAGFDPCVLDSDMCCGALEHHGGDPTAADDAGTRIAAAVKRAGSIRLVQASPGCARVLGEHVHGVRVDSWAVLLAAHSEHMVFRPETRRVAWHWPCTVDGSDEAAALRGLRARVAGTPAIDLPRPPHCCGAGGRYFLEQPEAAGRLRSDVLARIAERAPDLIVTTSTGCAIHLESDPATAPPPIVHAAQYFSELLESRNHA